MAFIALQILQKYDKYSYRTRAIINRSQFEAALE